MEKNSNMPKQSKRISASKNTVELKMDNNKLISTTAIEVSRGDNRRFGSNRRSSLPNNLRRSRCLVAVPAGGRKPGKGDGGKRKESTSKNKLAHNHGTRTVNDSSYFAQTSFLAYPSSYFPFSHVPLLNNAALAQFNVAPVPQRIEHRSYSDFVGHNLRKVYLFRDESDGRGQADGSQHRQSSTNAANNRELRDKEIVRTLRTWMPAPVSTASTANDNNSVQFTLMSYNVLAQDLLTHHEYLYRNHSSRALLWDTRWKNLFDEIIAHNADIICLQEVQESHIENYFSQLNNIGYANVYKKKTGFRSDGCAIYYRKALFKMIENTTVEYNQGYNTLDRDNVAIIVKLAPVKHPKTEFVVATTHLLYNPRREDVRLAQTQVLLAEVDRIAYKPGDDKYVPIIITGDFNSEPESAVFKLVVEGKLRYDNLTNRTLIPTKDKFGLAGKLLIPSTLRITDNCQHLDLLQHRALNATLTRGEEVKLVHLKHSKRQRTTSDSNSELNDALFSTGTLSHNLRLQSTFIHRVGNDTVGTTNQDGWITVDYIFYSGAFSNRKQQVVDGKLRLLSRYSIPTTQQLLRVQTIPNFALGSDHLALLSKFKLEF